METMAQKVMTVLRQWKSDQHPYMTAETCQLIKEIEDVIGDEDLIEWPQRKPRQDEDTVTIKIHGSESERQAIVNRLCEFLTDEAPKLNQEWGSTKWGWTMESSREPELF